MKPVSKVGLLKRRIGGEKKCYRYKRNIYSVAKGFPTLHGDSEFSIIPFDSILGLFSAYALGNNKTKKLIKNPDKS